MLRNNSYVRFRIVLVLILIVNRPYSLADENNLKAEVSQVLRKASMYLHSISTNGGYAGIYSKDLTERYGEALYHDAQPTQIWIQPPGTPSVGQCFLRAYRVTGNRWYLSAAVDTARALAWGQRKLGGWSSLVDVGHFESDAETIVRKDGRCTFDDNTTQGALAFLMDLDEVIDEVWLTETIELGLAFMLESQFDNGAWPQSYPLRDRYSDYYTFNDGAINDCIKIMLRAHQMYGKSEYLDCARRGGDFIILSQIPSPQAGWAQQYSQDLKPVWARRFEPPGVCSAVTSSNIYTLVDLYLYTKDKKYLEPVPKAIEWLKTFKIREGLWARLYELGTNRPIYGDREDGDKIHYDYEKISEREKRSYAWQSNWGIEKAFEYYDRAARQEIPSTTTKKRLPRRVERTRHVSDELRLKVKNIIEAVDDEGRWLRNEMISSEVFVRNAHVLCDYLEAVGQ